MEVYTETLLDDKGNVISGITVTVRDTAGAIVDLYEDRLGASVKSNPFTVGSNGQIKFAASDGAYTIAAVGTYKNVSLNLSIPITLFDPDDGSLFSSDPLSLNKGIVWGSISDVINKVGSGVKQEGFLVTWDADPLLRAELSSTSSPGKLLTWDTFDLLEDRVTTNEGDITDHTSWLVDHENRILTEEATLSSLSSRVGAVEIGQGSNVYGYSTKALMDADLVPDDQSIAYVTNDPNPAYNGTWRKEGATGVGSWVQSSYDRVAVVESVANLAELKADTGLAHNRVSLSEASLEESYDGVNDYVTLPQSYTLSAIGDFLELDFTTLTVSSAGKYSILGTKGIGGSNCLGFASSSALYLRDSEGGWHNINTVVPFANVRRLLRIEVILGGWEVSVDGVIRGTIATLDGKSFVIDSVGNAYGAELWPGKVYSLEINTSSGVFVKGIPSVAANSYSYGVALAQVDRGIIPEAYDQRLISAETAIGEQKSITTEVVTSLSGLVHYVRFNGVDSTVDLGETYILDTVGDYIEIEVRAYQLNTYSETLGILGLSDGADSLGFYSANSVWLRPSDEVYVKWDGLPVSLLDFHNLKLMVSNAGVDWELFIDGVSVGSRPRNGATFSIRNVGHSYGVSSPYFSFIDTRGITAHTATQDVTFDTFAYYPEAENLYIVLSQADVDVLSAADIYIKKTADSLVQFYIKGGGGEHWIEYPLEHITIPYSPSFTPSYHNLDSWNLTNGFEVNRSGVNFTRSLQIINFGAWECAIQESGAEDFIGSHAHGDEVLTSATLLVDGRLSSLSTTEEMIARSATFVQKSTLYRCNTLTPVANLVKRYEVTSAGITITSDIEWLEALVLVDSYLAMLPISRTSDGTSTGLQITDTGMREPEYTLEDLSADGFAPIYSQADSAMIWGSTSGVSAEVELVDRPDLPNREFNFSPASQYNKLYFDVSGSHTTQVGEKWRVKARYRIGTSN